MKELWINGGGRYINKGELFNKVEECLCENNINVTSVEIYTEELNSYNIYAYKGGWNITNKELPKNFTLVNYNSREILLDKDEIKMKTNYEKRFDVACERLNYLVKTNRLCKEVYTDFKDNKLCHYTERMPFGKSVVGILYWLNDAGGCPDYVVKKKEELEEKYDCTVYAVTHEYLEFGECWDFWTVHDEDVEDYDYFKGEFEKYNYTMAYVYNASEPDFSEFGTIGFSCNGGGMIRTC